MSNPQKPTGLNTTTAQAAKSFQSCAAAACGLDSGSTAKTLNRQCFCRTLNHEKLTAVLNADDFNRDLMQTHPQLFSATAVFISPEQLASIRAIIGATERVIALPSYQHHVLQGGNANALLNPGTAGVFMGFDFHLGENGPKIIEINTNAGGAFLNATLVKAQSACCRVGDSLPLIKNNIDEVIVRMFLREWGLQRQDRPIQRMAIVDESPTQQFLYPEFKMAQRLFAQHGIDTVIAAPEELIYNGRQLFYKNRVIDLIYNRLTDFPLTEPAHQHLLDAYTADAVVVTPNPRHHALYADKRNLAIFCDQTMLKQLGVAQGDIDILQHGIPRTRLVTADNAHQLWQERKHLFFKPTAGFGSRAAYRGDKLTKRVWNEIQSSQYVAQTLIAPSERGVLIDNDEQVALKMDIRAYVYQGEIQLLAARLYQGQTTNFRTEGGGFAPVYITE